MGVQRQIPVAEQVTFLLHQRILEGLYAPGRRLPSEAELAEEMGVSRGTVRSALASLATAGLIERRQGDGTYVRQVKSDENSLMHAIWEFSDLIMASGRRPSIEVVSVDEGPSTEEEAAALELPAKEPVISIVRLFFADEQPVIFSYNVSPATIFVKQIEQLDATLGIHRFLKRYCNRQIARVDMDISATIAHAQVREALSLEPNMPILRLEQIFRGVDRRPLVFAVNYYCGNKLSLRDVRPWHTWGSIS